MGSVNSTQNRHGDVGHNYVGTKANPPRLVWRHRLRFPLRQTDASKAQLWLQAVPDGHPPVALAVGSKFASLQSGGMPVVIAQDPKGAASKLGTILKSACGVLLLGKSLGGKGFGAASFLSIRNAFDASSSCCQF